MAVYEKQFRKPGVIIWLTPDVNSQRRWTVSMEIGFTLASHITSDSPVLLLLSCQFLSHFLILIVYTAKELSHISVFFPEIKLIF